MTIKMIPQEAPIKYFLYARKSSESEDRQIQSIDDQVNRLKQLANQLNLKIKKVYTESKTAKKPNNRPVFNEIIKKIENGEADGLLCWQINRLSRNPIDSGKLSWLLQQGVLKSIQTIDRQYLPGDNVVLFSVESGVANQFLIDLSKNVRRGIQRKLDLGWRPGMCPLGYQNILSDHTIVKDEERFTLVRKAWDLMLTGNYTVLQIVNKMNNEWGFVTPRKKRIGGTPIALSRLYNVFSNIFYAGIILHNGQQYLGKHEPMITMEEFDRVQEILGRKGKPRPKKHQFAFTGVIRCGECGCLHTAETKRKFIKKTKEIREYTYYHCTRRKRELNCSQKKVLGEKELERQIKRELEKYTILPEFRDWALEVLTKNHDIEVADRSKVYEMIHKNLVQTQEDLDELARMRYRKLIDDEIFLKEREELQRRINQLKLNLRETEHRADKWLELTEKTFDFATYAHIRFDKGNLEEKKEILTTLCSNPIIKNQELHIEARKWFVPIKERYKPLEKEYLRLELNKTPLNKEKREALDSLIVNWLGR